MNQLNILKYAAVVAGWVNVGAILGSTGQLDRDFMTIIGVGAVVAFECDDRRVRSYVKLQGGVFAGEALCRIFLVDSANSEVTGFFMLAATVAFVVLVRMYDRALANVELSKA